MTEFASDPGPFPIEDHDHDHDVLLVAGSRPEVARLAPVATAFATANRMRALTVATGADPMTVHETFEALGVPADVTLLLREPPGPGPAAVAATLMTRLDDLLLDLDPSAIMVCGGGIPAAVAAQVAFWRQIPVVHLQAGAAGEDLLFPFPQEANRHIIGQLASLLLTTDAVAPGSSPGPNVIPVGDTIVLNPEPDEVPIADLLRRVRAGGPRLVLVGLDRADSLGVLAGIPDLLEHEPGIEVVLHGALATHGAGYPLLQHPRATVTPNLPVAELVGLIAAATVLVSDDPELVADAPGLGTPAVLVDGPAAAEPGDSVRSVLGPAVWETVRQALQIRTTRRQGVPDGLEAARVEQAVAWMFGLSQSPGLLPNHPTNTDAGDPLP
jgi:UDP-N-acetylglucosamine 2-epimerase (non-hydrolysing)